MTTDHDSPIEWTNRAHLVTVSCAECGDSLTVPEGNAEARSFHTCDDCEHDCLDHFDDGENRSETATNLVDYTCTVCNARWEFDVLAGVHEQVGR